MRRDIAEPVGILGIGVEGRATIDYLLSQGIRDVTALDRQDIDNLPPAVKRCFGETHDKDLGRFATVFRSPGIRPDHPALLAARSAGTVVTSAISHFLSRSPAPVVGVTGTLGKGTAASLIAEMLTAAGFRTHLGGNIGRSPLDFLPDVRPDHRVVLEISSFQAMDAAASPRIAVVLKTTSEHLDWHQDREEYIAAKANLLAHQTADCCVVYNADTEASTRIAARGVGRRLPYSALGEVGEGIAVRDDAFVLSMGGRQSILPIDPDRLRLPGRFNRENIAAALLAALEAGAPVDAACRAAERFGGLPHRLQLVIEHNGARFYNDSYATRPDATIGAVGSFVETPLALILGGSEKHADFEELAQALAVHPTLRHVSLIGATAERMRVAITRAAPSLPMRVHGSLDEAVRDAHSAIDGSGAVLLSPACASFGLFPNYKVRGERFIEIATGIAGRAGDAPKG